LIIVHAQFKQHADFTFKLRYRFNLGGGHIIHRNKISISLIIWDTDKIVKNQILPILK
jgi:hypothetical protein